jgi:hypothetical protein
MLTLINIMRIASMTQRTLLAIVSSAVMVGGLVEYVKQRRRKP